MHVLFLHHAKNPSIITLKSSLNYHVNCNYYLFFFSTNADMLAKRENFILTLSACEKLISRNREKSIIFFLSEGTKFSSLRVSFVVAVE